MIEEFFTPLAEKLGPELVTFLISMLPLTELRGSIPFGIAVLNMNPWAAFAFSIAGNTLIAVLIYFFLDPVTKFLRKYSKIMDRFFTWLFHRTRTKHSHKMSELGHIALLLFVAVPLPGSGGWSGALVAYLFGVRSLYAIPLIGLGLILSGVIITFGSNFIILLFG